MNVTLQTNRFNNQAYNNPYSNNRRAGMSYSKPSFSGTVPVPTKSKLLSPFTNAMDKFTDWLAKNYTAKLYESKFAEYLSKKTENLDKIVNHMQVLGSVIISGMYMTQTLRNNQMDEDRKKTLAINQGLTFVASTIGSYLVDGALNKKWTKLTNKYAISRSGEPNLMEKLAEYNKKLEAEAKALGNPFKKKGLIDMFKDEKSGFHNPNLAKKIKGMGVLKSLLVFGTIYRFISPVAVTPVANWIGDKYLSHKKEAKEAKEAKQS